MERGVFVGRGGDRDAGGAVGGWCVCVCVCKMVAFHKDDLKFLKDERSSVVIQWDFPVSYPPSRKTLGTLHMSLSKENDWIYSWHDNITLPRHHCEGGYLRVCLGCTGGCTVNVCTAHIRFRIFMCMVLLVQLVDKLVKEQIHEVWHHKSHKTAIHCKPHPSICYTVNSVPLALCRDQGHPLINVWPWAQSRYKVPWQRSSHGTVCFRGLNHNASICNIICKGGFR